MPSRCRAFALTLSLHRIIKKIIRPTKMRTTRTMTMMAHKGRPAALEELELFERGGERVVGGGDRALELLKVIGEEIEAIGEGRVGKEGAMVGEIKL